MEEEGKSGLNDSRQTQQNQESQPQQPPQGIYQPVYQQPVYYQPVYQQPMVMPASEGEKEAYFTSGASSCMLLFAIFGTINLCASFLGDILSLDVWAFVGEIFSLLMVIGSWLVYANCKSKHLNTTGISLIIIPYLISFILTAISYCLIIIAYFFALSLVGTAGDVAETQTGEITAIFGILCIGLLIGVGVFVFSCICFRSINETLKVARDINRNYSVFGRKTGSFAAIVMIINAAITLLGNIVYSFASLILDEISAYMLMEDTATVTLPSLSEIVSYFLESGGVVDTVMYFIAFITSISAAVVLLKFGKLLKKAHGKA